MRPCPNCGRPRDDAAWYIHAGVAPKTIEERVALLEEAHNKTADAVEELWAGLEKLRDGLGEVRGAILEIETKGPPKGPKLPKAR